MNNIICIPNLHIASIPSVKQLPLKLFVLNPNAKEQNNSESSFTPNTLPFTYAESRQILHDLIEYGEMLNKNGHIDTNWIKSDERLKENFNSSELADLRMLTSGNIDAVLNKQIKVDDELDTAQKAQKILLLAWQLEKLQLEIADALKNVNHGKISLKKFLSESIDSEHSKETDSNAGLEVLPEINMPWQMIMEAMLYFLPANSILFTANQDICSSLCACSTPTTVPQEILCSSHTHNLQYVICSVEQLLNKLDTINPQWLKKQFQFIIPISSSENY